MSRFPSESVRLKYSENDVQTFCKVSQKNLDELMLLGHAHKCNSKAWLQVAIPKCNNKDICSVYRYKYCFIKKHACISANIRQVLKEEFLKSFIQNFLSTLYVLIIMKIVARVLSIDSRFVQ